MTAFEIVKAAYPGIPDAILNEYADLLPAEASALSAEFAATDAFFFKAWSVLRTAFSFGFISIPFWFDQRMSRMSVAINLLNPQNPNEKIITTLPVNFVGTETVNRISVAPGVVDAGPHYPATGLLNFTYDRRLFLNPGFTLGRVMYSAIALNNNPNAQAYGQYVGRTTAAGNAVIQKKTFTGIDTILAMYENGVTLPDVNYEKAYSFLTYVNAYKKFSTEIDSERAYLQREAEAQLASYRQDYTDRAQREKSDLQSKKIQMLMAIDNDTKAATRDFQNMLLNAQNLKQNLRGQIG